MIGFFIVNILLKCCVFLVFGVYVVEVYGLGLMLVGGVVNIGNCLMVDGVC